MTLSPESPLGVRLDIVLDELSKRALDRMEHIAETFNPQLERLSEQPAAFDSATEESPVNPLRHWRWE